MPDEIESAAGAPSHAAAAEMTDAELAEAKQYGRLSLACTLADKAVDLIYLGAAAFLLAKPIDFWLSQYSWLARSSSLRLLALFATITLLHMAVSFPISFTAGYRLEHRFNLSTLSFGGWLWRYFKRNLLGLAFGMVLMLGLYWLIWTVGSWWWLTAAGAFFLVSVLIGQLTPVLILPLFYKIERLDVPELSDRLTKLADGTGLSIEGVYRMGLSAETVKANAMLAGLGRTRRVLVGDTLLTGFTPDEIEVIFAHEIGHHVFRHIHKMILTGIMYSIAGFWICDQILRIVAAKGSCPCDIYANLPVWTLPLLMFVFAVFAQLLEPLQNAVSRRFERQSDRYALQRTGKREAYLSAFRKLAKLNKDDPHPPRLEVFLFHSHPTIGERLAMAENS
jgi:STE24 endopeptidase